jgi:hypothetical protein
VDRQGLGSILLGQVLDERKELEEGSLSDQSYTPLILKGLLTWPSVGHDDRLSICLFREKTHKVNLVFISIMFNLGLVVWESIDPLFNGSPVCQSALNQIDRVPLVRRTT